MKKNLLFACACFFISSCSHYATPSDNTRVDNSVAAATNAQLALGYLTNHYAARAKQKILLAQQQAPREPLVWYTSGYFFERTGDVIRAEQAYLRALQLAPQQGAAHNNYGAFLCRQGKYSQAIAHFLLAVNDPHYLNVGNAYHNAAICAAKVPDKLLAEHYSQLAAARSGSKINF